MSNNAAARVKYCLFVCLVEALLVTRKEVGLEVNAEETTYVPMFREKNVGQERNIQIGNKSFENVEKFKYFGIAVTNQNCRLEEIKSTLNSENACYHSVQNLLSSSLLSKNIRLKYTEP
jgi:hypothetical protein